MQTISVQALKTGHRLVTVVLVAMALAVAVTLGVVYPSGSNTSHTSLPSLSTASHTSGPITIERCLLHRPC